LREILNSLQSSAIGAPARASVKIDLLWEHGELGTYAQRCVINIKLLNSCHVHQFSLASAEAL
jgi:hypothetical protein